MFGQPLPINKKEQEFIRGYIHRYIQPISKRHSKHKALTVYMAVSIRKSIANIPILPILPNIQLIGPLQNLNISNSKDVRNFRRPFEFVVGPGREARALEHLAHLLPTEAEAADRPHVRELDHLHLRTGTSPARF